MNKQTALAVLSALILSGCTASVASSPVSAVSLSLTGARELTPDEKRVIMESLSESIRDPEKAKYLWAPFPEKAPANGQTNYCAAVNAKSPHAPYNGLQPYLVKVQVKNGQIVASVVGAIAGGNDKRIVRNLCAKSGLNPDDAV